MDKFRNERLRGDLGVNRLLDFVEDRRLRWYGHIMRMSERRISRRYLQRKLQEKGPVGGPRKRWLDEGR